MRHSQILSLPAVAIPLLVAAPAARGQAQGPWTVTMRAMQNPLPLGQCTAIEITVADASGRAAVRPDGSQVDWQDFALSFVAPTADAFAWSDAARPRFLCARAPTAASAMVVAYYPAPHLTAAQIVPGMSAHQTMEVALQGGAPQQAAAPAAPNYAGAAGAAGAAAGAPGAGQPQQAGYPNAGAPAGAAADAASAVGVAGAAAGAPGAGQPPQAGYPNAGAPAGAAAGAAGDVGAAGAAAGAAVAGQPQQAGYPNAGAPAGAAAGAPGVAGQAAGAAVAGQPQQTGYPNPGAGQPQQYPSAGAPPGAIVGAAGAGQPQQYPSAGAPPGAVAGAAGAGQPQQAAYPNAPASPQAIAAGAVAPAAAETKKKGGGGFFKKLGKHLKDKAGEVANQTAQNLTTSATQVVDATAQSGSNLVSGAAAQVTSVAQSKVGSLSSGILPSALTGGANADNLSTAIAAGHAELRMMRFIGNTEVLDATGRDLVRQLAAVLKTTPGNFLIQAHVDLLPSPAEAGASQALSQRRAAAVKGALIGAGIEAARLTALGYGTSSPRPESPPEGGPPSSARIEIWKMQ